MVVCCKSGCTKPGKFRPRVPVSTWQHMCVVVSEDFAALHLNGNTTTVTYDNAQYSPCANATSEGTWAKLGGDGFTGEVGDFRIFPGGVTLADQQCLASCGSLPYDPFLVTNSTLHGDIVHRLQSITRMCRNHTDEELVAFWVEKNHTEAKRFCREYRGRLPDVEESSIFFDYYNSEMDFWLSSEETDMCPGWIILPDPSYNHLISKSCRRKTSSVVCFLSKEFRIQLKGDDVWDFTLTSHRGFPVFKNKDGFTITLERKCPKENGNKPCAVLREWGYIKQVAALPFGNILGRFRWFSIDSNESNVEVLSLCDEDSFTCSDGRCIPLEQHCDSRPQCPDGSDEGPPSCATARWLATSDFTFTCYHRHPVLGLDVEVLGLHEVYINTNEFQVTLNITLTWIDPRLEFTNLQKNSKISKEISDLLWRPEVFYENAHFENNVEFFNGNSLLESFMLEPLQPGKYGVIAGYEGKHLSLISLFTLTGILCKLHLKICYKNSMHSVSIIVMLLFTNKLQYHANIIKQSFMKH